ncbi:MAG: hypothetical protein QNJ40_05125 [Xanthomonadales bacterium]|nr:hypothetical protein [Xanthomonadales bacterium]
MNFFDELKRRNVIRVAILYAVSSWLVLQVADVLSGLLGLPDFSLRLVGFILLLGFPLVLVFSWVYELTPEGVKRESEVVRDDSITRHTGRRLNLMTIALVLVGIAVVAVDRLILPEAANQAPEQQVAAVDTHGEKSVAVLPFVNMSSDEENEYFSDGIAEELLNVLVQVDGLRVASRTSAFSFKGKDVDIPTVAQALDVQHVVEGSVRRSGNQVRITAQIIEVATDSHLWSETYTRELDDVFAIQDEIAKAIADALSVELLGASGQAIATHETENVEAFDLYLLGRYYFHQRSGDSLQRSIELFKQVIELQPDYARAYSGLADAYVLIWQYGDFDAAEANSLALQNASKALELSPDLAEAHASVALAEMGATSFDPDKVEFHARRAMELNPGYSMTYMWLGNFYHHAQGRVADAHELFRQAEAVDPLHPVIAENIGATLISMGRNQEAEQSLLSAREANPSSTFIAIRLAEALQEQGDLVGAYRWLTVGYEIDPTAPLVLEDLVELEFLLGNQESAFYWLRQFEAAAPRNPSIGYLNFLLASSKDGYSTLAEGLEVMASQQSGLGLAYSRSGAGKMWLLDGNYERAEQNLDRVDIDWLDTYAKVGHHADLALLYSRTDRPEEALEQVGLGRELLKAARGQGYGSTWLLEADAIFLAMEGNANEAVAALELAFDQGNRWHGMMSRYPVLDVLLGDDPDYRSHKARMAKDLARQREQLASMASN